MESTTGKTRAEVEKLDAAALVARLKASNPELARGINDRQLNRLVRQTLRSLAEEINARDEGRIMIRDLGRVNIRVGERERDGEAVKTKRISLKLSGGKE